MLVFQITKISSSFIKMKPYIIKKIVFPLATYFWLNWQHIIILLFNLSYTFGPILWYYLLSSPCASSLIYNIWKITELTLCHVFQDGHNQDMWCDCHILVLTADSYPRRGGWTFCWLYRFLLVHIIFFLFIKKLFFFINFEFKSEDLSHLFIWMAQKICLI